MNMQVHFAKVFLMQNRIYREEISLKIEEHCNKVLANYLWGVHHRIYNYRIEDAGHF